MSNDLNKKNKHSNMNSDTYLNLFSNPYKHYCLLSKQRVSYFFRSIKYSFQRARYGWCESDTYDIFSWFQCVLPSMLREYAENLNGFPDVLQEIKGETEKETFENWKNYLKEIAYHIDNSNDDKCPEKNEYIESFINNFKMKKLDNLAYRFETIDEEISKKYSDREKEIQDYKSNEINKALDMLKAPVFFNLWD